MSILININGKNGFLDFFFFLDLIELLNLKGGIMKKLLVVLMSVCVLLTALSACSSQGTIKESENAVNKSESASENNSAGIKVAFSQSQSSDPWRIAMTGDIKAEAEKRGIDLIYTDGQGDTSKQISDVEDIVSQGVDYLIYAGREYEASAAALDTAKQAGVKVILVDRLVRGEPGEDYITYIGTDFIWEAETAGNWLIDKFNGEAKVVEITGTPGSSAAIDRSKGIRNAFEKAKGMEIIASQTADFSRSEAQKVAENIIQSTGGEFDAIFAHNDEMAMGAIQAIKSSGLVPGKDIIVISNDGQKDAVEAVISGEMGCTVTCNPRYGQITFDTLEKIVNGEEVPEKIVLEDYLIDSENAEERLQYAH